MNEARSDSASTVEERVIQCMSNEDCECTYCNYRHNSASMVVDFLSRDMIAFEKNHKTRFCTFDLKDIFFKAIMEIKRMEKDPDGDEEN